MMTPTDPTLYAKIKTLANTKFLAKTSIYKSAWIVREYKKQGGKFREPKDPDQGLTRWFKEKWVDVNRPGQPCGRTQATTKGVYPLCRPTKKVTEKTPVLLNKLSRVEVTRANKEKQKVKQKKSIKFTTNTQSHKR